MLFLPHRKIKYLSLHPLISSLTLLFIYPSHLSLRRQSAKLRISQKFYVLSGVNTVIWFPRLRH
jgi:hypothetical protein